MHALILLATLFAISLVMIWFVSQPGTSEFRPARPVLIAISGLFLTAIIAQFLPDFETKAWLINISGFAFSVIAVIGVGGATALAAHKISGSKHTLAHESIKAMIGSLGLRCLTGAAVCTALYFTATGLGITELPVDVYAPLFIVCVCAGVLTLIGEIRSINKKARVA